MYRPIESGYKEEQAAEDTNVPAPQEDAADKLIALLNRYTAEGSSQTFVYTQFVKEGYHCFPEAGVNPEYKTGDQYDVSHLAARHMHYFYFKVHVSVNHDNRDIEFIQLRRWLESLYDDNTLELNNKSCEMLARELAVAIDAKYPYATIIVDVSEDNINGALVTYQRPRYT